MNDVVLLKNRYDDNEHYETAFMMNVIRMPLQTSALQTQIGCEWRLLPGAVQTRQSVYNRAGSGEDTAMVVQAQTRMTAADYYALPEYAQHTLIELIDGEVVIKVAPIPLHQQIVGNTHVVLWMIAKQQGGMVFLAPVEVYLDEYNIYEPDVVYLAPNSRCVVEEKRLMGAPDLVVEVLSPGTAKHDRETKFNAYQRHGVREYWIVDPANRYLEQWILQDGAFVKGGTLIPGETFTSPVLGSSVEVSVIFS